MARSGKRHRDRLSDPEIRTLGPGPHHDGGGLALRVRETDDGALLRSWVFRFGSRKMDWGHSQMCP